MTPKEISQEVEDAQQDYFNNEADLDSTNVRLEEALKQYHGVDRVIAMKDFKMPISDEKNSFNTGIAKLDEITGRLKKGDIFTITAATGVGKSTFARELLIRFSHQDKKSLYFSYEDRNEGLIEKLGDDIPDGYIPNILNDKSLIWIEAKVLEAVTKFKVEIVFIDNLKAITDFTSRNVNQSIEFTMQKLKEIAMKYNIMIFLCAHIRKEDNKSIDINSIKDSSAVADISSLVIAIKRNEDKMQSDDDKEANGPRLGNLATISVIKNRNTGIQKGFTMLFYPNGISGRYEENINQIIKI